MIWLHHWSTECKTKEVLGLGLSWVVCLTEDCWVETLTWKQWTEESSLNIKTLFHTPFPSQRHTFISLVNPAARRQCTIGDGTALGIFVLRPPSSHVQVGAVFPAQFCPWGYLLRGIWITMLVTGICPVSRQSMHLGPTEWPGSLYFAGESLLLEVRFTEIWCIRMTRNLRKVDCRF